MKWRIHTSITVPSAVGSSPDSPWAVVFQRHQIHHFLLGFGVIFFENYEMAHLTGFRGSVLGHRAEFFHVLKISSSPED